MSGAGRSDSVATEEGRAAARSLGYRLFVVALGYPEGELLDVIRAGVLCDEIAAALEAVDPALGAALDRPGLADVGPDDETLAVEYTRLFDVGAGGPPAPLYGGLYSGARMKTMEEAVRFYNYFGLRLSEGPRELPDHLTTELEFLHYLTFCEAETLEQGGDPGPFRRAERDFLARHPGSWVPKLVDRLGSQAPARFFAALFEALLRFLESEQAWLRAAGGQTHPEPHASVAAPESD